MVVKGLNPFKKGTRFHCGTRFGQGWPRRRPGWRPHSEYRWGKEKSNLIETGITFVALLQTAGKAFR
jgi:hypothetical protein